MAATVYSVPKGMEEPEWDDFDKEGGGFDTEAYFKACDEHQERLAKWCREHSPSKLAGEVMHFSVADGKATYMVYTTKPLALIHLNYVDGYQIDPMMLRGMRVADVREHVKREKNLAKLFGREKD